MLQICNFDTVDDMIYYIGESQYIIAPDAPHGYVVYVTSLDEDGEPFDNGDYAASSISAAIDIVERLENGESI